MRRAAALLAAVLAAGAAGPARAGTVGTWTRVSDAAPADAAATVALL